MVDGNQRSKKRRICSFIRTLITTSKKYTTTYTYGRKNANNWLNMSKKLEKEISLENYKKFAKTTARLDKVELFEAYKNSLLLVMDLQSHLIEQYNLKVIHDILERLLNYISE